MAPRSAPAYEPVRVDEQCEAISVLGDVAKDEDGKPSLHLHGVLGLKGGRTVGGHVQALHVRPTLEVVLTETPACLSATRMWRNTERASLEKKPSMRLSQEPCLAGR